MSKRWKLFHLGIVFLTGFTGNFKSFVGLFGPESVVRWKREVLWGGKSVDLVLLKLRELLGHLLVVTV